MGTPMPPDDPQPPEQPARSPAWPYGDAYGQPWIGGGPPRTRSTWGNLGIALAVVAGICGVVLVGLFVLFAISLNSWGNNK
jgi:hypothetical protein